MATASKVFAAGRLHHRIFGRGVHLLELFGGLRVAHLEAFDGLHGDRGSVAPHRARQHRTERHRTHRRHFAGRRGERAIHPAILRGLAAGRAGFHVILRVEVGSRRVRGTDGIDNRQMLLVEERLERRQRRVQSEEAVEVDGGAGLPAGSLVGRGMAMVGRRS